VAPKPLAADTNATGGPPVTSIRFNCPSAKNAIAVLSGDQKGLVPFSVPGNGCARKSIAAIQRREFATRDP
jgi:hypothetical protein